MSREQFSPVLNPGDVVETHYHLALFLHGSEDSFTGLLLQLIAKADPGNKAKLRRAFPYEVAVFDLWQSCDQTPTAAQLLSLVKTIMDYRAPSAW